MIQFLHYKIIPATSLSYFYHFNDYSITTRFIKKAFSKDILFLRLKWFLISDNLPSQN